MDAFAGFAVLAGSTFSVPIQVINSTGTPATISGSMAYRVYTPAFASVVVNGTAVTSGNTATGLYHVSRKVFATAGFAAGGKYILRVDFTRGGVNRRKLFVFNVV